MFLKRTVALSCADHTFIFSVLDKLLPPPTKNPVWNPEYDQRVCRGEGGGGSAISIPRIIQRFDWSNGQPNRELVRHFERLFVHLWRTHGFIIAQNILELHAVATALLRGAWYMTVVFKTVLQCRQVACSCHAVNMNVVNIHSQLGHHKHLSIRAVMGRARKLLWWWSCRVHTQPLK